MIKRWIVSGGLIVLLGCTYPIQANDSSEISIFKAAALDFFTQYAPDGEILRSSITLFDNKKHTVGGARANLLPKVLKETLFSSTTYNPFKAAYEVLYTPDTLKQMQSCPFVGAEFDLDNNHKTQEWYIATSTVGCVKSQPYINGITSHNWILQKTEKGIFRVLMESDEGLFIAKLTNKNNLYRPIEAFHVTMRFNPSSKVGCGAVRIDWTYNPTKQQYQMGKTRLYQYNCPSAGGNPANIQRLTNRIKGEIDPWMNKNLKAFR